jgi:hypothetical protein
MSQATGSDYRLVSNVGQRMMAFCWTGQVLLSTAKFAAYE